MARNYNNGLDYLTETDVTIDTFYAGSYLHPDFVTDDDYLYDEYDLDLDDEVEYDYDVWDVTGGNAACDNTGYCSGISCPYYRECQLRCKG